MDNKRNLPSITRTSKALESLSPLQLYLREVIKYPLLSPQEEYELAVRHFENPSIETAHRLVTANLRLVVKIANEFRQTQANLLDLIQEGNAGLMQAVKKFNPYKGVKLSSYASWWIRAYILKYIMDNKSQVRIGTTAAQRKLFFNLRKEAQKLLEEYDHVNVKLLAENLDVKEKDVIEMQQRLGSPDISLDQPVGSNHDNESKFTQSSVLVSDNEPVDDMLAKREINELFKDYLDEFKQYLQGKELYILNERLLSENPLTLQQIATKYGITRERVRQLEVRVIQKLKEFVKTQGKIISVDE